MGAAGVVTQAIQVKTKKGTKVAKTGVSPCSSSASCVMAGAAGPHVGPAVKCD